MTQPSNVRVVPPASPTWECGSCQAQVPSAQITESFYRGQAVCKDCEELLLEESGFPHTLRAGDSVTFSTQQVIADTFDRADGKGVRGQQAQWITMDEIQHFPRENRVFTMDSLDGRPLRVTWGKD